MAPPTPVGGDNFAADPGGLAGMLGDILLDGLVVHPEG
jgi:hypothetical protein